MSHYDPNKDRPLEAILTIQTPDGTIEFASDRKNIDALAKLLGSAKALMGEEAPYTDGTIYVMGAPRTQTLADDGTVVREWDNLPPSFPSALKQGK